MIPDAYCWAVGLLETTKRNADKAFRGFGYICFFGFTIHFWLKAFGF